MSLVLCGGCGLFIDIDSCYSKKFIASWGHVFSVRNTYTQHLHHEFLISYSSPSSLLSIPSLFLLSSSLPHSSPPLPLTKELRWNQYLSCAASSSSETSSTPATTRWCRVWGRPWRDFCSIWTLFTTTLPSPIPRWSLCPSGESRATVVSLSQWTSLLMPQFVDWHWASRSKEAICSLKF